MAKSRTPSLIRTISLVFRTLVEDITDPYRPELHYMRGPGPKWRHKHGIIEHAGPVGVGGLTHATA